MSIDAALGRIEQIMAMQRQLFDPSSAATTTPATTPAQTAGATQTTFATALASAQGAADVGGGTPAYPGASSSPGASSIDPTGSGYVNPLAGASVRAERIDQGVDYAGSGTLGAIGPGVVTKVVQSGSGWMGGGYVEYKLTAGPYAGRSIYYAEGVTPSVSVGDTLAPGQPVATIIPGSSTGIEMGFASGRGESSYASVYGGGYSEGQLTAAGVAFSNLLASLGAPPGLAEGRQVVGKFF